MSVSGRVALFLLHGRLSRRERGEGRRGGGGGGGEMGNCRGYGRTLVFIRVAMRERPEGVDGEMSGIEYLGYDSLGN